MGVDVQQARETGGVLDHARAHLAERGRTVLQRIIATEARTAPAVARLALGLVMLPHALQNTIGWFGGPGFVGANTSFQAMGIPFPLSLLAILAELCGAIGLVCGLLTRVAAIAIVSVMVGAIVFVHLPNGLFMNWSGQQAGEGFEYRLLAIALGIVCLLEGGGRASVDRALMR